MKILVFIASTKKNVIVSILPNNLTILRSQKPNRQQKIVKIKRKSQANFLIRLLHTTAGFQGCPNYFLKFHFQFGYESIGYFY